MSTTPTHSLSYCVHCDAKPGDCDHGGPRYLDPIAYERVDGGGFRVPDHERERWDYDGWTGSKLPPTIPAPKPKTLREILAAIELHAFMSQNLKTAIHDAYDANPMQTTILADHLTDQASNLDNPTGFLISRLRQIEPTIVLAEVSLAATKRPDDIL